MMPAEISRVTGISPKSVTEAVYAGPRKRISVHISRFRIRALREISQEHGTSLSQLCTRLIYVLAEEPNIVRNLLEEREG
jgi:hypothetical protein